MYNSPVPVCPHAGGVGLCELVQHLAMFDFVAVSGTLENRYVILCLCSHRIGNFPESCAKLCEQSWNLFYKAYICMIIRTLCGFHVNGQGIPQV